MNKKKLTRRQKLRAVLFGLLITVVLIEVILRSTWLGASPSFGFFPDSPWEDDPNIGNRLQPNWSGEIRNPEFTAQIVTNSDGFRSDEEYTSDGYTVAVIGDSFVMANQVEEEDRFTDLLQEQLSTVDQVQNYGLDAIGTPHYLQIYRHYIRQHAPDLVIICFFGGNDLANSSPDFYNFSNLLPNFETDSAGNIVGLNRFNERSQTYANVFVWLARNIATFRFLLFLRANVGVGGGGGIYFPTDNYEQPLNDNLERAWDYVFWSLDELVADIRADGSTPLLVYLPAQVSVEDHSWEALQDFYETIGGDKSLTRLPNHPYLVPWSEENNVPFIDVTEALRAAYQDGKTVYLENDRHFTVDGHIAVTEALTTELTDRNLLPPN